MPRSHSRRRSRRAAARRDSIRLPVSSATWTQPQWVATSTTPSARTPHQIAPAPAIASTTASRASPSPPSSVTPVMVAPARTTRRRAALSGGAAGGRPTEAGSCPRSSSPSRSSGDRPSSCTGSTSEATCVKVLSAGKLANTPGGSMPIFFFTVEQQERAIVERFGKFVRVAGPGLQTKTPFVERVAGRMSLQVEQLNAQIETKTKDNVFVQIKLAVQYKCGPSEQQVQDAFYKLDDPEVQMQAYAFDVVRSHIPSMDLDEAYADADTIAMHIQDTLHRQMADYGYEIVKALVTNIEPDQKVKDAMNNINAAQRNQVAAAAQGDAKKTLAVKKAEGEKETMRLQGEGVAAERRAIAEGLRESLEIIAEQGLDPREAMALVALTQYTDMIRALGEGANTNTILLPHSPSGVGDQMAQIRDGILVGNAVGDVSMGGPRKAIPGGSGAEAG